jgi:hypothetical protein
MLRVVHTLNWFRSQAFSTSQRFPHGPSSTALFHTAAVPGLPPSESSPREDRAPLSGFTGSLAVIHRAAKRTTCDLITRGFTDAHAFDAVAWIPHELWVPFSRARRRASRSPWITAAEPFLPPASPASKLFSLHESVRTASSCPEPSGRYSLGLLPLLRFSTAQTSDPRPAWTLADPSSRPLPKDRTRDSRDH